MWKNKKMKHTRNVLNREKTIKKRQKDNLKLKGGVSSSVYDLTGTVAAGLT
jgi:hypothetical protein